MSTGRRPVPHHLRHAERSGLTRQSPGHSQLRHACQTSAKNWWSGPTTTIPTRTEFSAVGAPRPTSAPCRKCYIDRRATTIDRRFTSRLLTTRRPAIAIQTSMCCRCRNVYTTTRLDTAYSRRMAKYGAKKRLQPHNAFTCQKTGENGITNRRRFSRHRRKELNNDLEQYNRQVFYYHKQDRTRTTRTRQQSSPYAPPHLSVPDLIRTQTV